MSIIMYLYPLRSDSWPLAPFRIWVLWIRKRVTGRFWTSCLHTSHVLLPFIVNHLMAHSLWARASSPLQLHSILKVSPPSQSSTRQILQTASSSGMSSPSASLFSEMGECDKTMLITAYMFSKLRGKGERWLRNHRI